MLNVGDLAPDFELLSDEGEPVKLSELRGQRILLFFYPKADTPGCTRQACGFRDGHEDVDSAGSMVLGISPDSVKDLRRWREKINLPYNLLSDPEHEVADLYGVWGEKKMFGKSYLGVIRSHFVVGADGRLEDVQVNISPEHSVEAGLAFLAG